MDLCSAVIADQKSLEVVQPGEGTLDHPAVNTETRAVLGAPPGDQGLDVPLLHLLSVAVMVVAAVGQQRVGPRSWMTHHSTHRRDGFQERYELGHVIAVAPGHSVSQGEAAGVYQEVMLRSLVPAVNRTRARLGAPFFACT